MFVWTKFLSCVTTQHPQTKVLVVGPCDFKFSLKIVLLVGDNPGMKLPLWPEFFNLMQYQHTTTTSILVLWTWTWSTDRVCPLDISFKFRNHGTHFQCQVQPEVLMALPTSTTTTTSIATSIDSVTWCQWLPLPVAVFKPFNHWQWTSSIATSSSEL